MGFVEDPIATKLDSFVIWNSSKQHFYHERMQMAMMKMIMKIWNSFFQSLLFIYVSDQFSGLLYFQHQNVLRSDTMMDIQFDHQAPVTTAPKTITRHVIPIKVILLLCALLCTIVASSTCKILFVAFCRLSPWINKML